MRRWQGWQRGRRSIGAWLPVALWAAMIFVLSSIPGTNFPTVNVPNADKLVHTLVYAVLGALLFRALTTTTPARPRLTNVLLAAAFATLYGISDEIHQIWTPHRSSDWHDVVADAIGGASGAFVLAAARWPKIRA